MFEFGWIDINGDALHASMGLPPALNVAVAKVRKLEIIVSISEMNFAFSVLNYNY